MVFMSYKVISKTFVIVAGPLSYRQAFKTTIVCLSAYSSVGLKFFSGMGY